MRVAAPVLPWPSGLGGAAFNFFVGCFLAALVYCYILALDFCLKV
jgi:hypothetical protein